MSGLTRRDVLRTGLAAVALGAGSRWMAPAPAFGATVVPYLPYSAGSYFKSTVTGAPLDATTRTASFRAFMKSAPQAPYPLIKGVGGNTWGSAYAEGSASDPIWTLTGTVPTVVGLLKTQGFHAPEWFGSMLTGTTDSPFCVLDRGFGYTVFAGKAKVVARTRSAWVRQGSPTTAATDSTARTRSATTRETPPAVAVSPTRW